jgi:hypothetical protein
MNIIKALKLARSYSKAKKVLKKEKTDVNEAKKCLENLRDLLVELEEGKEYFVEEIKKIKDIVTKLSKKIKEVL